MGRDETWYGRGAALCGMLRARRGSGDRRASVYAVWCTRRSAASEKVGILERLGNIRQVSDLRSAHSEGRFRCAVFIQRQHSALSAQRLALHRSRVREKGMRSAGNVTTTGTLVSASATNSQDQFTFE